MMENTREAGGEFDRVGMVYDLLMDRLGVRRQLGPEQQMRLFQMVSPEQLAEVIGQPGTEARGMFEENLQAAMLQLDPTRRFTTQQLLRERLDPTQYLVVWQSMNEGMMNLLRLQAMENVMGQMGPRGAELRPVWAAQMPEFRTFWTQFQAGLLLFPDKLREEFIASRDSQEVMLDRVAEAIESQDPVRQRQ